MNCAIHVSLRFSGLTEHISENLTVFALQQKWLTSKLGIKKRTTALAVIKLPAFIELLHDLSNKYRNKVNGAESAVRR